MNGDDVVVAFGGVQVVQVGAAVGAVGYAAGLVHWLLAVVWFV